MGFFGDRRDREQEYQRPNGPPPPNRDYQQQGGERGYYQQQGSERGFNSYEDDGYSRPNGPPPPNRDYDNFENDGFSRPNGRPPPNRDYEQDNQRGYDSYGNDDYSRPNGPPPPNRDYRQQDNQRGYNGYEEDNYSRPNGQPNRREEYNRTNEYNDDSRNYQRPGMTPPSQNYNNNNNNYQQNSNQGYRPPNGPPQGYVQPENMQRPPQSMQNIEGIQAQYQYSQCTGKRKALLIGINYLGTKNQLNGCINDVHNIHSFLTQRHGYNPDDIVMLTDDQQSMAKVPTRDNMIRAMKWLVKDAQPNDSLFFHYSGHGGQVKDEDGDEEDGLDDVIYPIDFESKGPIIDDEMHDIMVKPLPAGVRLTALFDSCHSGTVLDLPYTYSTKGVIKEPSIWKDVGENGIQAAMAYAQGNRAMLMTSLGSIISSVKNGATNNVDREKVRQIKFSPADVVMISGSKDNQTSADSKVNGVATGAMSYAFIQVMTNQPEQSYLSLLKNMRSELAQKYTQKPQLSASHPIDVNVQFII
ncbi:hypothetical protein TBLA_0B04250 [Henningerozyma blattae CBS 6284]|uniref:Metacaspase-1 n=1 Tax=Henningerozyma blattae (strain ATCC 34711 / CBS 6284 / DSM 70876 / NBRC 10599 / NRRL Y-10934 / UCD 77-7) TaxID=1071380 RepID=I2GYR1_HENB6|nr:hypothetical protein TBLA_0B04250 [Tetrapisispora blattae CBS 6284]CCH59263.1 hypothetical protein TBLA_0B04250 [Tetrapisispora blattae CBS 6284]